MQVEDVVDYVVKHKSMYPGAHQYPASRSSDAFKPLEPKSQMLVAWKGLCEYLKEKVINYKGVYVKNFGTFTYEVTTTLPKLGIDFQQAKTKTFQELLLEKKSRHILRPCFIIDPKFKPVLTKFLGKEELTKPKSQSSIYQKGFQMNYCNPVPIAAACFLDKNVVQDSLNAIFAATFDLITLGVSVILKTGFCNIYFVDRNLKYSYSPEILAMTKNLPESESKFIQGVTPIDKTWRVSSLSKWGKSTLSSMLERPQTPLIKTIDNKTQMLKIMSLDLCSTYGNGWKK